MYSKWWCGRGLRYSATDVLANVAVGLPVVATSVVGLTVVATTALGRESLVNALSSASSDKTKS